MGVGMKTLEHFSAILYKGGGGGGRATSMTLFACLHTSCPFWKGVFVPSCLLAYTHLVPSEKRSSLEGKNLLQVGANSCLLEKNPYQKKVKTF